MNLAAAILYQFPGKSASPIGGDFLVADDGSGPYIAMWNASSMGSPQPGPVELAAWVAAYEASTTLVVRRASVVAQARLIIDGEDIQGVETSVGFGAAMSIDTNIYWVFFSEPQPDDDYIAFAQDGEGAFAAVTDANVDYVEITVKDASGSPITPTKLSVSIQRAL